MVNQKGTSDLNIAIKKLSGKFLTSLQSNKFPFQIFRHIPFRLTPPLLSPHAPVPFPFSTLSAFFTHIYFHLNTLMWQMVRSSFIREKTEYLSFWALDNLFIVMFSSSIDFTEIFVISLFFTADYNSIYMWLSWLINVFIFMYITRDKSLWNTFVFQLHTNISQTWPEGHHQQRTKHANRAEICYTCDI